MNIYIYLTILLFSLPVHSCSGSENEKISLIKTVYLKNDSIWRCEKDPYQQLEDLTKLYQEYCSTKFCRDLIEDKQTMGLDHDLITADYGMDENAAKTLVIQSISDNMYHVSYVTAIKGPTGTVKTYHVKLQVKLIRSKTGYEIDDVTDMTVYD